MYCHKFFATLDEAEKFKKDQGFGAIYRLNAKVKKGQGPNSYTIEAYMAGMTTEDMLKKPFCVAWNEN